MVKKLWEYIFRKVLGRLDGHKTTVSAVLIVLATLCGGLEELLVLYSDVRWVGALHGELHGILMMLRELLMTIGIPGLHIGVLDKVVKD